jgi:hypothetical protein
VAAGDGCHDAQTVGLDRGIDGPGKVVRGAAVATIACLYSTVGLTLNFTPTLTEPSKYILIACMFIGRIGMLNLMVGLLRRLNHQFYEYPKENILIN